MSVITEASNNLRLGVTVIAGVCTMAIEHRLRRFCENIAGTTPHVPRKGAALMRKSMWNQSISWN